jgi:hypothetical protein
VGSVEQSGRLVRAGIDGAGGSVVGTAAVRGLVGVMIGAFEKFWWFWSATVSWRSLFAAGATSDSITTTLVVPKCFGRLHQTRTNGRDEHEECARAHGQSVRPGEMKGNAWKTSECSSSRGTDHTVLRGLFFASFFAAGNPHSKKTSNTAR